MKGWGFIQALCASCVPPSPLSPFSAATLPSLSPHGSSSAGVQRVAARGGSLMPLTSLF